MLVIIPVKILQVHSTAWQARGLELLVDAVWQVTEVGRIVEVAAHQLLLQCVLLVFSIVVFILLAHEHGERQRAGLEGLLRRRLLPLSCRVRGQLVHRLRELAFQK